jgi:hypothetical protein
MFILCHVSILRPPSCCLQMLWQSLFAIPPCIVLVHARPIHAMWDFSLVMCLVMVPWLVLYSAMMKPRASYGPCPQGYAARHALVSRSLVMIHYETTLMCYLLVIFPLVISPYLIRRSIYQTKSSRASFWSCKEDNPWRTGHWHKC